MPGMLMEVKGEKGDAGESGTKGAIGFKGEPLRFQPGLGLGAFVLTHLGSLGRLRWDPVS